MPELPEVETIRASLVPRLLGRRVAGVDARPVKLRAGLVPDQWGSLTGAGAIERLERRGKYLLVRWRDAVAVFHLGMSGRLTMGSPEAAHAAHTHLVLRLDDGQELRFVDPRRFGMAVVLAADELAWFAPLAGLGPDALDGDVAGTLLASAPASRVAIRNLLLDQSVVAGLGNIYANEALARSGIRPSRRSHTVSRARLVQLAGAVHDVLTAALMAGGTTLADGGFVDAAGEGGYFAVELTVYGREAQGCGRCGTTIVRKTLTGRSIFYCPQCQR